MCKCKLNDCTRNIVSQEYFNKIYILRKKRHPKEAEESVLDTHLGKV